MLTRCKAGMVIVANEPFVTTKARETLLGQMATFWTTSKKCRDWISWKAVAQATANLPGSIGGNMSPIVPQHAPRAVSQLASPAVHRSASILPLYAGSNAGAGRSASGVGLSSPLKARNWEMALNRGSLNLASSPTTLANSSTALTSQSKFPALTQHGPKSVAPQGAWAKGCPSTVKKVSPSSLSEKHTGTTHTSEPIGVEDYIELFKSTTTAKVQQIERRGDKTKK